MEVTCQCLKIRFATPNIRPTAIYICHCTQCRHQSSSAFGISVIYPYFNILSYVPNPQNLADYTRKTFTGAQKHNFFCKNCGSRLLHHTEGGKTVSVKGGAMPGLSAEMMQGAVHIWAKEAVVEIPNGVERYEEEPPDEE